MKLSFTEQKLLKSALKKETNLFKALIILSKICLLVFGGIFLFIFIWKQQADALLTSALFLLAFYFVFTVRQYQKLIKEIVEQGGIDVKHIEQKGKTINTP